MMNCLVIFDLDGTLLNTLGDLAGGVNSTLRRHGLPVHPVYRYKQFVGRGMRNLVIDALPEEKKYDDRFVDSFLSEFIKYYSAHIDAETVPYPGIVELVARLGREGVKLAVASNKIQSGVEHLMSVFFPGIHFDAVCGNTPQIPLKPDAAMVRYIMDKAGTTKENTVMVGDSDTDIMTARNAGIPVVAVSWGFRPLETICTADKVVGTADELLNALLKYTIYE